MRRSVASRVFVVVGLIAALAFSVSAAPSAAREKSVSQSSAGVSVPRADCGPGSYPEAGVQGQQPADDTERLERGYRCNLELVGQYLGDGGNIQIAWNRSCVYMGTLYSPDDPEYESKKGTVVIDASDPASPREVTRLQTPAMVSASESLRVNERRDLLAANEGPRGFGPGLGPGPSVAFYDVSKDCRQPRLLSSFEIPDAMGHEGDFAPDGRTYYETTGSNPPSPTPVFIAMDVTDPRQPTTLLRQTWPTEQLTSTPARQGFHAVVLGDNGNVGYFTMFAGMAIVDLSEVQERKPDPQIRVISDLSWDDSATSMIALPVQIRGRSYVFVTDESGPRGVATDACAEGLPPYGGVHVIDTGDLENPREVARIQLETGDPANCDAVVPPDQLSFLYSVHYCTVDNPMNATALACSWQGSGLRVFDIRDPLHPREIAYYNPPPRPDVVRGNLLKPRFTTPDQSYTGTRIRWQRDRDGVMQLWFMSMENGFQIVRFTNDAYPLGGS